MEASLQSDEQKSLVAQLKARHSDLSAKDGVYYDDFFFSRWLVARAWDLEAAHSMLEASKAWRAKENIDTLLERYAAHPNRALLEQYAPGALYSVDKRGCPVYIDRIGKYDAPGLLQAVTLAELSEHHVFQLELAEREKTKLGVAKTGVPFRKHIVLEDLGGLGWSHVSTATTDLAKSIISLDESHFPESMQKMFIINTPWIFNTVWKIIKPIVSERTVAKIEICGADYIDKLREVMDDDQIPVEFGGTCQKPLAAGGPVPEACWRGANANIQNADTVHEFLVNRSDTHEVRLTVAKGQTLIYEFWTDDYDLQFGISFCSKSDATGARLPLIPTTKHDSHLKHVTGDIAAPDDGALVLVFDNTHSMFRKKQLYYKLSMPTTQDLPAPAAAAAAADADDDAADQGKKKKKSKALSSSKGTANVDA
jgi:hypothetical protein